MGTGIIADFPDIALTNASDYILRFHVDSNAATGNNFALDNLSLESPPTVPTISSFVGTPDFSYGTSDVTLNWTTNFAGRLVINDGSSDIDLFDGATNPNYFYQVRSN